MNYQLVYNIIDLYVNENFRGKQIAQGLVQNLKNRAKNNNTSWISVGTSKENLNAKKLYTKLNFQIDVDSIFYFISAGKITNK